MIVQHNLGAMNSNRMLNLTVKSQAKSTERLSSGYRINRAADDAAGLSISEKMRKQIRGLTQASSNAQDGISMVQTADGAMAEVLDMLQRGNELAVKAANGTLSDDDRKYIQDEIEQLEMEIDRVRATTKFNEIYVLQGDVEEKVEVGFAGQMPEFVAGTSKSFGDKVYSDDAKVVVSKTFADADDNLKKVTSNPNVSSIDTDGDGTDDAYEWTGKSLVLDFKDVDSANIKDLYNTGFCSTCGACEGFINIVFTDDAAGTSKTYKVSDKTPLTAADLPAEASPSELSNYNGSVVLEVGIRGLKNGEEIVDAVITAAKAKFGGDASSTVATTNKAGSQHYVYLAEQKNEPTKLVAFYYAATTVQQPATDGYAQNAVNDGIFAKFKSYSPLYIYGLRSSDWCRRNLK